MRADCTNTGNVFTTTVPDENADTDAFGGLDTLHFQVDVFEVAVESAAGAGDGYLAGFEVDGDAFGEFDVAGLDNVLHFGWVVLLFIRGGG